MDNRFKTSAYNIFVPFLDTVRETQCYIGYNTVSRKMLRLEEKAHKAVQDQALPTLPHETHLLLKNSGFVVEASKNELDQILEDNIRTARASKELYLVIQPSAYCQFACHYCGQEHRRKNLKQKLADRLLLQVERKLKHGSYKNLSIGWFGAEPTLNVEGIKFLSGKLQEIAASHNAKYSAKMVTNGFGLDGATYQSLSETCKIASFEITLDGNKRHHDARRLQKNAKGTFDEILTNIKNIVKHTPYQSRLIIRSNVDDRNYESLAELLQLLNKMDLSAHLSFYLAPLHSWGNDAHLLGTDPATFASREIETLLLAKELGFGVSLDIPNRLKVPCMALNPNSYLIDPEGGIYGCTEQSLVPAYVKNGKNTGEIGNIGSDCIANNTEALNTKRPFLRFYEDQVNTGKVPCRSCKMLPICGGRCPKEWAEGHIPCPSFKYNFPQRLLLAYANAPRDNQ